MVLSRNKAISLLSIPVIGVLLFIIGCEQQTKRESFRTDIPTTRLVADSLRLEGNKMLKTQATEARRCFQVALDMCLAFLPKNDELVLKLYHNIGSSYLNEEQYNQALVYFDSVRINQTQPFIEWLNVHNDFKIGKCYLNLGDIDLAKFHLQKAIQFAPNYAKSRPILPFILLEYAECLRLEKQYPEAIQVSQKAIDSSFLFPERTQEDSLTYAHSLFDKSNILANTLDYAGAIDYGKKTIDIYKKVHSDYDIARLSINLSDYYRKSHQYLEAEQLIDEGIAIMKQSKEYAKRIIGILYTKRGNVHADQNRHDEALMDYDTSMSYIAHNFQQNTEGGNLLELETEQNKRPYLMGVLTDAALSRTKLLEQGNVKQRPIITKTYNAIIHLTEAIRRDYLSEDAKLNLSADVKPILEKAFAFSRPLSVDNAFGISEQSKSMTLLESVRLNNRDFTNRPNAAAIKQIQEQLMDLKKNRTDIEKKLSNFSPNSAETQQLNADLTKNIANERSMRLKFNAAIGLSTANDSLVSVANIQNKLLAPDQALIEYFMQGDSILTIFCLTQNEAMRLETVALPKNFAAMIAFVLKSASETNGMQEKKTCDNAYKLYQLLIEPIAKGKTLPPRLIIVGEGPLSNFPFDVLLTQPANDYPKAVADKLPLMYKHAISYSYSANLLWEMRFTNKTNGQKGIAAFAPAFPKEMYPDTGYMNLALQTTYFSLRGLQNVKEIENIGHKAHLYRNETATIEAFKEAAKHQNVLHIATHCMVNYTNPDFNYISFSQNSNILDRNALFYLKDLYSNPLPVDLAVFSACQSAIGKEIKGEAPLSMARGLAHAGVRSFIATQWFVHTDKNADFYPFFYELLMTGTPKDVALQKAKQQFIDYGMGNRDPSFWASMILIGNTEPVDFQGIEQGNIWWLLLAGLALLVAFLVWRERKII